MRTSRSTDVLPGLVVAIDGGKTNTVAALFAADGTEIRRASGPGLAIVAEPTGERAIAEALAETLRLLEVGADAISTVAVGINGIAYDTGELRGRVIQILRGTLAAERYLVCSDVVTSYYGALGARPGVVVAVGTGTIVLALGPDGTPNLVDGAGPLFADRGSGYDIGRRGLDAALRFADGCGGSEALHRKLVERFGDVGGAITAVYRDSSPVRVVASFSRDVEAAALEGDPMALQLWNDAAEELARSVTAAIRSAGFTDDRIDVAPLGGLIGTGDLLRVPFVAALARLEPRAILVPPAGDAVRGAGILARLAEPPLPSMCTVATR